MNTVQAPAGRRASPSSVLERWRRATMLEGWRFASDWMCAEVQSAASIFAKGGDLSAAVRALGEQRAYQGVGIAESLTDLHALYLGHGRSPDFAVVTAFAEAWVAATERALPSISCQDVATGLSTPEHFSSRVADLYADADGARYIVAVIRFSAGFEQDPDPESSDAGRELRWERRARIGEAAQQAFPGCGALLTMGPASLAIVLPDSEENLARLVGCTSAVRAVLSDHSGRAPRNPVGLNTKHLPPTVEEFNRLLAALSR